MPNHKFNFISNIAGGVWLAAFQLIFVPVYIRLLGMESYGLIGLYASLQAWMSVMDLGMTPTLTREMARSLAVGSNEDLSSRDILRTLEIVTAVIAGLFLVLLILSADWISTNWLRVTQLPTSIVAHSILLMGGVVAARWMAGLYRGGLMGLQKQVRMNLWTSFFGTLRIVGVVPVLIGVSQTIRAFFLFQGAAAMAELFVLRASLRASLPPSDRQERFSWVAFHQVKRFAGGMTLLTLLGTVVCQLDKIVLSKVLPLSVFGHYAFATAVASSLNILVLAVGGTYSPRLSQLVAAGDAESLKIKYHEAARLMSVILISTGVFLVVFPDVILTLWTGNAVFAASITPVLVPLAIGTMLSGLMNMPFQLQIAYGWTRLSVWSSGLSILFLAMGFLFSVPRFGHRGAAVCWALLGAGQIIVMAPLVHRKLLRGEFLPWLLGDVGKPAVVAVLLVSFSRVITDGMGITQTKGMWIVLPFLGLTTLAITAGVSGFWKYLPSFRKDLI